MKKSSLTRIQIFFWIATLFYFVYAYGSLVAVIECGPSDSAVLVANAAHLVGLFFIILGISTAVHAVCKHYKEKGSN